jgi:hypothetical protein
VSDAISQAAPTDWMRPPKLDAMLAIHTPRKTGIDSGDCCAGSVIAGSMGACRRDAKGGTARGAA